ncbi:MAG: SpoIIE family protein phosphatase [Nocardioidaceae bacterium]
MGTSRQAVHQFAPQATSADAARKFVRQTLRGWGADAAVDDAVLLTSELVTNAVVHAGTDVWVTCALDNAAVQIGVSDGHAARALPTAIGPAPVDRESGRGLYLVSEIAHTWGVDYDAAAKRVWFRLPLATASLQPVDARHPAQSIDLGGSTSPVRVAVVETDLAGIVRHWSTEAENLLGWAAAEVVGRPYPELVRQQPESDIHRSFAEVLKQPRWSGGYLVRTPRGGDVPVFASHLIATAGDVPRVVCLVVPAEDRAVLMPGHSTSANEQEQLPIPRHPGLLSLDALLELAVEHSMDLLGGDAAYVLLVTDDDLDVELRATVGLPQRPGTRTQWPKPADLSGAASDIPRAQVYADALEDEVPERFLADAGMRGLVTTPLIVGDRVVGKIGVAFREMRTPTEGDAAKLRASVERFSLAIESARLNETERARRGRVSFLAEASDLLAGVLDPEMVASLTTQLVVPRLADWCAVYLEGQRPTERRSYVWHARETQIDPLRRLLARVPPPLLEHSSRPQPWQSLGEMVAKLAASGDAADDVTFAAGPAVRMTLHVRGRAIGTLAVGCNAGHEFRTGALDTLDDLSRRAAAALDNARLYRDRSQISQTLQRSMLPSALPAIPNMEVGLAYEAAGEGLVTGGDFYDLFAIDEDHWGFVVGDVCGKGADAAAVAGLARHSLRVLAREYHTVPTVLQRLNETILAEGDSARFVTLVYGELDPAPDGGMLVTFAAAGHPLPLLVTDDRQLRSVGRTQPLLGVLPEVDFHIDLLHIRPGEHLVCTTDGVTDRRVDGRTLGDQGLHELLRRTSTLPAPAVASRLRRAVLDFGAEPLQDDIAVLVLQPVEDGERAPGRRPADQDDLPD